MDRRVADKAHGGTLSNGLHIATPNGRKLSGDPKSGLAKWKALAEADRRQLGDLGPTDPALDRTPPAGCLVLDVFSRGLGTDDAGDLCVYRNDKTNLTREPSRDHLWILEDEWRAMAPADSKRSRDAYPLPDAVADRIARFVLVDQIRIGGNGSGRRREDVTGREFKLTALESTDRTTRLRLDGSAALKQHDDKDKAAAVRFDVLGFLDYDVPKRAFTRFDVVAVGADAHYDECTDTNMPLGVALRIAGEKPIDRVWPAFYDAKDYFGSIKK